ncbi:MAG: trypsin-like serine protease, partial [Myxococcota bacterium]
MYYALKKTLLCLASMSMIAGCSDSGEFDDFNEFDDRAIEDPATEDELVERNQEITGLSRIDDSNTSPRWPSVGQVRNRTVRCSGTLITPVHVLTAGHCFPGGMNGPTTVIFDATANSTSAARTFNVIQESALGRAVASGQDLSILLLDRTVPTSIATPSTIPTGIFAEFLTAHWTRTFWTVGFGQDCARTGTGTRRGLLLPSSMATYSRYPGVLAHPNGNCFNPTYLAPQPGDSGGPLFDSSERVIAVFS